jgi:hypothetical protein
MEIKVHKPKDGELETLNVKSWGIWEKEISVFNWHYATKETCYILEGEVEVSSADQTVKFGVGDIVEFPEGLDVKWNVIKPVKKHYRFGG